MELLDGIRLYRAPPYPPHIYDRRPPLVILHLRQGMSDVTSMGSMNGRGPMREHHRWSGTGGAHAGLRKKGGLVAAAEGPARRLRGTVERAARRRYQHGEHSGGGGTNAGAEACDRASNTREQTGGGGADVGSRELAAWQSRAMVEGAV